MASINIDLSDDQAARICAAFGKLRGLRTETPGKLSEDGKSVNPPSFTPRDATLDEVGAELLGYISGVVQDQERAAARAAAEASVVDLTVNKTAISSVAPAL